MVNVRGACVLGLVLASGCAAIAGLDNIYERDDGAGGDGSGTTPATTASTTTGSASSGVGAGGEGGLGGAGGVGGVGGGAANGGAGGVGGEGGPVEPSIVTLASLYMNCVGSAMAVEGTVDVKYDNTNSISSATAKVTSAKFAMTYLGSSYEWSFAVTPQSTIVPARSAPVVKHAAGAGSGMGTGQLCDYCAGVWTLTVTWDINGKVESDTKGPEPVNCAL
jgi:hypothetical protein